MPTSMPQERGPALEGESLDPAEEGTVRAEGKRLPRVEGREEDRDEGAPVICRDRSLRLIFIKPAFRGRSGAQRSRSSQ
jgi:hypothetical protein